MKDIKVILKTVGVDKPNVELGFDQVLDLVETAKEAAQLFEDLMDNGGVGLMDDMKDIPAVLKLLGRLNNTWENVQLIVGQLEGVELDEAEELITEIAKKFEVTDAEAKEQIEAAVLAVYHLYNALRAFRVV